jgi:hypothetical protein
MKTTTLCYKNNHWSQPLPAVDSAQTLVLVFAAKSYQTHDDIWQQLKHTYPHSIIAGCSTAGEIFDDMVDDESISCAVVAFEQTSLRFASTDVSNNAGQLLAEQLNHPSLSAVLVLSDGLTINGSELVDGLISGLDSKVIITGGLAADGANFGDTWTLVDGQPQQRKVTAVGFYGDAVKVSFGSKGGWDLFGPERLVTKSTNNIVHELDNQPALALYKEYLGELVVDLPASGLMFPLALKVADQEEPIVRTLLGINEADQSLIFAGDVPQGMTTQLMRANFDRLIDGAAGAAEQTLQSNKITKGGLSIAISCVGRKIILKERIDEEVEATRDILAADIQQVGFYSYGELSPTGVLNCRLHNQTMTLTVITESV